MSAEKTWLQHYPDFLSENVDIPDHTLNEMLEQSVETYPKNDAISFYGAKITYQELLARVNRFASSLQSSGVKKGDRVAIMLPNCPHYVIAYYGILKAGAIVTQINPMSVEGEMKYFLNNSGAETIITLDRFYEHVKNIKEKTPLRSTVVVRFENQYPSIPDPTFETFLERGMDTPDPVLIESEDVAVLQYTGGTTGRSKGAMLTHRNLVANVIQTEQFFQNEFEYGKDKALVVIPLFHVMGMTSCMNLTLHTGGEMVILPRFDLEEVMTTIKDERPTTFPAVPTIYVALNSHPRASEYDLSSINICNSGSAPMPVELMRSFENKTGSKILEGYGLSESSPTTHCNPPFAGIKPGSVGIGLPGTDYKIVDLGTGITEMPAGEVGEVIIRGPQVMKGYWEMPEETAHTLRDGWLYTGDIGRMDEDGYLYIVDRKKDMIIASGQNVYPRDVEEVLYEHPSIQEAVAIGIPDAYRGENVKAILVLKEGERVQEEAIIEYCRAHMAAYKVPRVIEFRNELPKTNVGKILRKALRDEVNSNER
ncbi:long-chain acyl-CoA synthetase [Geomicrobium halophilum]|uniref:Long-chain acyl-CoA synthetase n=1 Tax=Geomicrobium halophilum TaxID=549000 RepID=A0A841PSJ6_9BACL|nr:long-chain fatty acid--CoA ligase [Geomicrobium halophilum]MBB6450156.1 long-chain acyl-CoA synthetase [Geomicrobium halophilum]